MHANADVDGGGTGSSRAPWCVVFLLSALGALVMCAVCGIGRLSAVILRTMARARSLLFAVCGHALFCVETGCLLGVFGVHRTKPASVVWLVSGFGSLGKEGVRRRRRAGLAHGGWHALDTCNM